MKIILSLISCLLLIGSTNAQGIAFGVRTGLGANMDALKLRTDKVKQLYWEKQLFAQFFW